MIEKALFLHLTADPQVDALIGNGIAHRMFPHVIPQKVPDGLAQLPCLLYDLRGVSRQVLYCGTSRQVKASYQIDAIATTYEAARALAAAVREALIDFSGRMAGLVEVRTCTLEAESTIQDFEPGLYRSLQSWFVWYLEE
jgi:Protein of unknown function (DUF3168)